jgi:hypothetical protein
LNCTKSVVDFTLMTERQIITFFKNHKDQVCGRFSNHQLDKVYPISLRKTPWYMNRFLHFAMSGLLTLKVADGAAQTPVKTEQIRVKGKEGNMNLSSVKNKTKRFIEGKVVVEHQSRFENTFIKIIETGQSMETDSSGKFRFDLPQNFTDPEFTITFSRPKAVMESLTFRINQLPLKNLIIHMYDPNIIMGEVMYQEK